ncbi:MAG: DUF4331 family protein [Chloroflexota bacterium]|nr:MAG: hypothetical protein DLM70_19675 [Chloroflexota bacterium]
MSHHFSGPNFGFPRDDARLDITDLFAFPKPGDAGKSIVIMDVHPSFSVAPPGPTTTEPFAPEALYELKVDTNGDLIAEIAYRVRFVPAADGGLTATLRRTEGPDAAGVGETGDIIVQDAPVSTGHETHVTEAGPYRFFAGWRSDPFFFDAGGALNNLQFTGEDTFADKNVCSIALELTNTALGTAGVNLWHRSLVQVDGAANGWVQADRGARPSQSVFLPGEDRDAYLGAEPAQDDGFVDTFSHALEHAGGYTPEDARIAARSLLPDVLPYDYTLPAAYPANGRALTDDVGDVFLAILTNGKVTSDKVGPHTDLSSEFPYVGTPHNATPRDGGAGYSATAGEL